MVLEHVKLSAIDLSALPKFKALSLFDISYNRELKELQFPPGMESSKLKTIKIKLCGIEELDCANLNCLGGRTVIYGSTRVMRRINDSGVIEFLGYW